MRQMSSSLSHPMVFPWTSLANAYNYVTGDIPINFILIMSVLYEEPVGT